MLATAEYAVRELGSIRRRGETLGAELSVRGSAAKALRDAHELRDDLTRALRESNKQWLVNQKNVLVCLTNLVS